VKKNILKSREEPLIPKAMASGITQAATSTSESEERRKQWMRFDRSRQPVANKGRKRRVSTVPADMELMMATKPESIGAFFELWVGNDGGWGRVDVYVRKWKNISNPKQQQRDG
jgi:hypothetical protein